MNKNKIVNVLQDGEWVEYTHEEFFEYFNFVNKPNLNHVHEIYLNGSGSDMWMRILVKENFNYIYGDNELIYNKVHGTYVELLD